MRRTEEDDSATPDQGDLFSGGAIPEMLDLAED